MKTLFRKIHLWLALPFGLIISVICFSGAMLVFEKDIYALFGVEERLPFFSFMFRLHRWLLDVPSRDGSIEWGKLIVGTATLLFVFVLVSGIVMWWPRTKKILKNSLKIHIGKGRRFWYDLHVAGGMYVLILLLLMALTGLTWSFSWYAKPFYGMFGADVPVRGGRHGAKIERVEQQNRGGISVASTASDDVRAQRTREVRRMVKSLHTGAWGGLPVKVLYFVAAIIGASLPLTGYYLWYGKRFRRKR